MMKCQQFGIWILMSRENAMLSPASNFFHNVGARTQKVDNNLIYFIPRLSFASSVPQGR